MPAARSNSLADGIAKSSAYLPRQRGNVSHKNLTVINAILYVTENGCKLARPAQAPWHVAKKVPRCSSVTIRNNDQHAAYAAAARLQAGRSEARRPPQLIA